MKAWLRTVSTTLRTWWRLRRWKGLSWGSWGWVYARSGCAWAKPRYCHTEDGIVDVEIGCYSDVGWVDVVAGSDKAQDQEDVDVLEERDVQTLLATPPRGAQTQRCCEGRSWWLILRSSFWCWPQTQPWPSWRWWSWRWWSRCLADSHSCSWSFFWRPWQWWWKPMQSMMLMLSSMMLSIPMMSILRILTMALYLFILM